jgi:hypothetical protein
MYLANFSAITGMKRTLGKPCQEHGDVTREKNELIGALFPKIMGLGDFGYVLCVH